MPRYDFQCPACQARFEVQATFAEYAAWMKEQKIACAQCGSKKVIRVLSAPNIRSASSSQSSGCCPGGSCG